VEKPKVTFYHRKKFPNGNFSLEFIFDDVRHRLRDKIESYVAISSFHSVGILKRLYNIVEAPYRQGDVNHITGDIHYVSYLLNKNKTILTILDCGFMDGRSAISGFLLKLFWLTIPIRKSRYITAISTFTKDDILSHVPCDPNKIKVIPVAISERFTAIPKEFNGKKPDLLQIGSAPNKNLNRIIEAIKGLQVHLSIIGVVNDTNKQLMEEYQIDYTQYINLSDDEVMMRYVECDILLFPSTYEGFGMPILEAQAIGRPVITSTVCSMPEVAGDAALLVDPYSISAIRSAIISLIKDNELRNELLLKGFENIKRYDADVIANMYYQLYGEVWNRSKKNKISE
jgi:glycosyltransferase involved in cell wall biosynthesis